MGIRVNEMIGWALVDLKTEKGEIVDERLNPAARADLYQFFSDRSLLGYHSYLKDPPTNEKFGVPHAIKSERAFIKTIIDHDPSFSLNEVVEHDGESGLPNILLFRGFQDVDWHRSDDIIDYCRPDRPISSDPCRPQYQLLHGGIYPYTNKIIDTQTGWEYKWSEIDDLYRMLAPSETRRKKSRAVSESLAIDAGFKNATEARARLWNKAPDHIIAFIRYTELFVDDRVEWELRPIWYRFWR